MDSSETTITGELTGIKKIYDNERGENISFIIQRKGGEGRPTHEFLVSAYTRGADQRDKFGISHLIGEQVVAQCYVNGRIRTTNKGEFHIIDLNLKSIEKVN